MEWVKMDDEIWYNGICMKWMMEWDGSQLMKWSEVWEVGCNSWYVLFNCRKISNFKNLELKWGGWSMEWNEWNMEWSKVWMNEWDRIWMNE